MVLGSGRTWPHDFLFLTGFFSDDECSVAAMSMSSSASGDSGMADRRESSRSSEKESGVIISLGLRVEGIDEESAKSDEKLSPGAERKDSAGEASNLRRGDCWNAIVARLVFGLAVSGRTLSLMLMLMLLCSH